MSTLKNRRQAIRLSETEFDLSFPYSPEVNAQLKANWTSIFDKPRKVWRVHVHSAKRRIDLLAFLDRHGFVLEEAKATAPKVLGAIEDLPWEEDR